MQIQKLARREMLKRFLASVPLPSGASADLFSQHLEALITAGYDEPDDVADLEEDEAERMGISLEHVKILVAYADEVRAQPAYKANSAVFRIFVPAVMLTRPRALLLARSMRRGCCST